MSQASSRVCKIKQLKKTFIQWCLQKGSKRHVGSDQESVVSTKRSYVLGNAIFGKYDPDKLVADGPKTKMEKIQRMKMKITKKTKMKMTKMKRKKTKKKRMFLKRRKSIKFDHGPSEYSSREFTRHIQ